MDAFLYVWSSVIKENQEKAGRDGREKSRRGSTDLAYQNGESWLVLERVFFVVLMSSSAVPQSVPLSPGGTGPGPRLSPALGGVLLGTLFSHPRCLSSDPRATPRPGACLVLRSHEGLGAQHTGGFLCLYVPPSCGEEKQEVPGSAQNRSQHARPCGRVDPSPAISC